MNMVANEFTFHPRAIPPFVFASGQQPANRQITSMPSQSRPLVNGIVTVSPPGPTGSASSPFSTGHTYPVLIRLHSTNTGLATEMFLQSWDEDHERAMVFIGAILYSDTSNASHVLDSFVQALLRSRPNSLGDITRLLMSMH